MTMWTDPGRCSTCKFCSIEPADMNPVCNHPKVIEAGNQFGIYIDNAIQNFCGTDLKLREEKEVRDKIVYDNVPKSATDLSSIDFLRELKIAFECHSEQEPIKHLCEYLQTSSKHIAVRLDTIQKALDLLIKLIKKD